MRSNYKPPGRTAVLFSALLIPVLSSAFIQLPTYAQQSVDRRYLLAQADGDAPPELNGFRRRTGRFGLKAEDSNSSYGERPFRRPRENQMNDGNNDNLPRPAEQQRPRPFAGALTPNDTAPRLQEVPRTQLEGRPGLQGLRARMRGQGMPEGAGFGRRPLAPQAAGGKFQTSGGLFGSKKPLDFSILQLSDEQKNRIRSIRRQNAAPVKELQKTLRDQRMTMRDLMFDPNASDEQIRSKRKEIRQMQDRMEEAQINDFLSIRHVLSPEQRQRLPDLKPGQEAQGGPADGGPPR